ncbi:MAG: nitroreductase family protein [Oscillospiraceae bacterium]|nr:nitroreductase family protein [Oscillospiraceae bacterium]
MDFIELAAQRYSCKKYSDQPVEQEKLNLILEAGRLAPTAKNLQEQRVYIARSADALAKIDQVTPCRYGAGTVLVVAYDANNTYTYPGEKYSGGVEDATIVATHMMLAAKSVGVESCWLNKFNPDELHAVLGLPENEKIVMLLDLGYPAEGAGPLPNHSSRKPLAETVKEL